MHSLRQNLSKLDTLPPKHSWDNELDTATKIHNESVETEQHLQQQNVGKFIFSINAYKVRQILRCGNDDVI